MAARTQTRDGRLWVYVGDGEPADIMYEYTPTRSLPGPIEVLGARAPPSRRALHHLFGLEKENRDCLVATGFQCQYLKFIGRIRLKELGGNCQRRY